MRVKRREVCCEVESGSHMLLKAFRNQAGGRCSDLKTKVSKLTGPSPREAKGNED